MKDLITPITTEDIESLNVGDQITITGDLYCGRDAVLPRVVKLYESDLLNEMGIHLEGKVIFHTAVSKAGVGPTSSNKLEIEGSIGPLSKAGVKIHLGKGAISDTTIKTLNESKSIYAIIPPVTALLQSKILEQRVVAFEEEGMEALYELKVVKFPAIIASVHGKTIYE